MDKKSNNKDKIRFLLKADSQRRSAIKFHWRESASFRNINTVNLSSSVEVVLFYIVLLLFLTVENKGSIAKESNGAN